MNHSTEIARIFGVQPKTVHFQLHASGTPVSTYWVDDQQWVYWAWGVDPTKPHARLGHATLRDIYDVQQCAMRLDELMDYDRALCVALNDAGIQLPERATTAAYQRRPRDFTPS